MKKKKIAEGSGRNVYRHTNDKWVVKYPKKESKKDRNLWEWEAWQGARNKGVSDYLVPVVDCHPDGDWLIMEYAPMIKKEEKPERQEWMRDAGWRNWGKHNGKIKLLDYGREQIVEELKKL